MVCLQKVERVQLLGLYAGRQRFSRTRLLRGQILVCSALALAAHAASAQPADLPLPRNDYGSVGLIDMPSARMMPDGALSAGTSFTKNIEHFNFSFQVTPWLETDFRYSGLEHFDPAYSVYYDRAFGGKLRLWDEQGLLPAVALGANDLVGTGVYSGEYIVASKQFGAIDATIGLGWGRLGSTALVRNPVGILSKSFDTRQTRNAPGATAFGLLFHGDVGLFGGLVWRTPIDGLSLLAEYSSDKYTQETLSGATQRQPSQFNFGAAYQWGDDVNLSLGWLYGDRIMGAVSFQMDTVHDPFPQRIGPPPAEPRVRSNEEQQRAIRVRLNKSNNDPELISATGALVDAIWAQDQSVDARIQGDTLLLTTRNNAENLCRDASNIAERYVAHIATVDVSNGNERRRCLVAVKSQTGSNVTAGTKTAFTEPLHSSVTTIDMRETPIPASAAVIKNIRSAIAKQNIQIDAIGYQNAEITVYYTNTYYASEAEAIERLIKLLMVEAPITVEQFHLIPVIAGLPQREFDVLRSSAERSISQHGTMDLRDAVDSAPAPMENPILASGDAHYPHFGWAIFPQFRQQLFDPSNPFAVQLLAAAGVGLELVRGLTLNSELEYSFYDNFNTARPADSLLPHVRTDYLKFFTQGKNGIGLLDAEYRFRLSPEVFATLKAGYLESMYMGAGGEILWRPSNERWALGADIYDVQERGFDRLFDLRHYHVVTGHVSLYWASPWYDLNFEVRAGQYLAGDRGVSFIATRRFASGVEIGAFFTRTNVSSVQFGEGSFDKGIIVRIPLGWTVPINSQSDIYTILRPVQRDGGQTLLGDANLYEETRRTSEAEMYLHTGEAF